MDHEDGDLASGLTWYAPAVVGAQDSNTTYQRVEVEWERDHATPEEQSFRVE